MRKSNASFVLPAMIPFVFSAFCTAAMADDYELKIPAGLHEMKIPDDNPLTEAKIELGKQLYFDPRLSSDNTISCASCHDPEQGWANNQAFSLGVKDQKTGRNSPTIINAGYSYFQFWDGRAEHVEGQATGPMQAPGEMNMKLDALEEKLNKVAGYKEQFQKVFGTDVTADGMAKAIGAFERTILSGNAPYDQFKAGDESALSETAQQGMKLFFGKANCSSCHSGPNFTDFAFHNIGVGMDAEEPDKGRFAVSNLEGDTGSFKTPTLREIARTAPYMHDGSLATLEDVVEHYVKGGVKNDYLDEEIFPLKLSDEEKQALITFLKEGLSSEDYPVVKPPTLPE